MTSVVEPVKILLVDDLKENLLALESLLRSPDREIFLARSGNEALNLLLEHDFAVALVDVQMPEMDGFELAEIMRSASRTREIPIIFVTAASWDERKIFKGYDTGAVDFLYKPLKSYVVKSKVQVFCDLYRQKEMLRSQLSETERALADARRAREALKEAVATRDRFLSIASHELKTPLTSLKIQLQLTERFLDAPPHLAGAVPQDKRLRRGLSISNQQVNRLAGLVDDLLDVSRSAAGRLTFEFEPMDLDELVRDVIERFGGPLSQAGCQVKFSARKEVRGTWDRSRIDQVVTNLLSNAMKYAPGSTIEVDVEPRAEEALISVRDHGPGIPPEHLDKLFDRFERAAAPSGVSGLGLGLYITKQIVVAHGGRIEVHSEPGKGACFHVLLPKKPAAGMSSRSA